MAKRYTSGIILFILFSLSVSQHLKAADNGVGVTLINYTLDTTTNDVNLGYSVIINARVTNYDSVPFYGSINFGLHNDAQELSNESIFDKPPYSGDSISLGGYETVPAIFSVIISTPYFRPGPDVVVVWPISKAPIADSILIHLNILGPAGMDDVQQNLFTYVVTTSSLMLRPADSKTNFKQVRIYNCLGQKVIDLKSDFISSVPLPVFSPGIYYCQLTTSNGNILSFKFPSAFK